MCVCVSLLYSNITIEFSFSPLIPWNVCVCVWVGRFLLFSWNCMCVFVLFWLEYLILLLLLLQGSTNLKKSINQSCCCYCYCKCYKVIIVCYYLNPQIYLWIETNQSHEIIETIVIMFVSLSVCVLSVISVFVM